MLVLSVSVQVELTIDWFARFPPAIPKVVSVLVCFYGIVVIGGERVHHHKRLSCALGEGAFVHVFYEFGSRFLWGRVFFIRGHSERYW